MYKDLGIHYKIRSNFGSNVGIVSRSPRQGRKKMDREKKKRCTLNKAWRDREEGCTLKKNMEGQGGQEGKMHAQENMEGQGGRGPLL